MADDRLAITGVAALNGRKRTGIECPLCCVLPVALLQRRSGLSTKERPQETGKPGDKQIVEQCLQWMFHTKEERAFSAF
jgi:hypothetical protein